MHDEIAEELDAYATGDTEYEPYPGLLREAAAALRAPRERVFSGEDVQRASQAMWNYVHPNGDEASPEIVLRAYGDRIRIVLCMLGEVRE